jgi:predicted transcriptional regulator
MAKSLNQSRALNKKSDPMKSNSLETQSPKRMSVTLSGDAARLLEQLAESQGITQTEALRKAIATESYLQQEVNSGSRILLQKADKEIREVIFR